MTRVLIAYSHQRVYHDPDGNPKLDRNILSAVLDVQHCLQEKGHKVAKAILRRNPAGFLKTLQRFRPNVIFNLCEEVDGDTSKEKAAAAFFELLDIPFTGNDALALALCLNKPLTKRLLQAAGIPTPAFLTVEVPSRASLPFAFPAIVKPMREDGSLGITAHSVVHNRQQLVRRVAYIRRNFCQPALVEKFIPGREFQVALLGNPPPRVLAVAELSYEGLPSSLPKIVSYAAKWHQGSSYYKFTTPILPAPIDARLRRRLCDIAIDIAVIFELRGYARVDFRADGSRPYVIDVNPNPDISEDAGLARAARWAGLSYPDLVDRLVRLALE
jgi:D-alanine-D-alanine ligase